MWNPHRVSTEDPKASYRAQAIGNRATKPESCRRCDTRSPQTMASNNIQDELSKKALDVRATMDLCHHAGDGKLCRPIMRTHANGGSHWRDP
jgi:hypothetical protein